MDYIIPGYSLKDLSRILTCLSRFGDQLSIICTKEKMVFSGIGSNESSIATFEFNSIFFDEIHTLASDSNNNNLPIVYGRLELKTFLKILKNSLNSLHKPEQLQLSLPLPLTSTLNDLHMLMLKVIYPYDVIHRYNVPCSTDQPHLIPNIPLNYHSWNLNLNFVAGLLNQFDIRSEYVLINCDRDSMKFKSILMDNLDPLNQSQSANNSRREKKPPLTYLNVETNELEDYNVQEPIGLILNVKEFKAILVLAKEMECGIESKFTRGGEYMHLTFNKGSTISFHFILATDDDYGLNLTQASQDLDTSFLLSQNSLNSNLPDQGIESGVLNDVRELTSVPILDDLSFMNQNQDNWIDRMSHLPRMSSSPAITYIPPTQIREFSVSSLSEQFIQNHNNSSLSTRQIFGSLLDPRTSSAQSSGTSNNNGNKRVRYSEPQSRTRDFDQELLDQRILPDDIDDPDYVPPTP